MKRFLSLFITLTLMLTLFAGCGGSGKTKPVEGGMKIATTTADFGAYSDKHTELIDYLHQAGFRYIDLSFYSLESMDPFMEDDWQEYAQQLKKHVADKKMEFVQAHSFGGNAIAPGFLVSNQNRALLFNEDGTPTARSAKILNGTPMGRFVDSAELLGGVFFLTDDKAASAITGVVLPIDCGFAAYSGV